MKNFKKYNGITLVSLVVTIVVLLILTGVTINALVGDNGLINMAKMSKGKTEEATKREQQQLASVFERNYVTYNGQLHVDGAKLMNEHNEEIRLKGTVLANDKNGKFTKNLLSNLKNKWNNNVIKVGCWSTESGQATIYTDEDRMKEMYKIIDDAIDLDMYVIVIFWSGSNLTENVYNEALDYFNKIATKYKDIPNIIYEIANEPSCEWDEIKTYANTLIPTIRNINPNSVILCPTQGHNSVTKVIDSKLEYENIMYVSHIYMGNWYDCKTLSTAILNKIPVFISEWSNSIDYSTPKNEETDKFIALMDRYNISSTFFILGEKSREGSIALVKQNMWDESLDDSTLTETGLYARRFFKKEYGQYPYSNADYTMLSDANSNDCQYFWEEKYRTNITQIITVNSLEMPNNVIKAWDISNGSGNVIAYLIDDNSGNNTYIAYIACNGDKIYAYDKWRLFKNFTNVEKIDLSYLDTGYVTDMREWFGSCNNLKEIIGIENFDTSNVTNMYSIFAYCYSLKDLDLTNFNTDQLRTTNLMFYLCSELKTLRLNKFSLDILTSYQYMFNGITSGINIYVPNEETSQFVYDRLSEGSRTGNIYYGSDGNWTKYE